ncbi:MAG: hypothetical protein IIB21_01845 [Chloroflexi bacterium]|nr:hypothetical protein [Chloroflexota bacterium]
MAEETSTIPESLVKAAEAHNWPLDLVRQGLAAGMPAPIMETAINSGMSPEQARERLLSRGQGGAPGAAGPGVFPPPLDMSWAKAPTQRGMRPKIGPEGLTLAAVDTESYADVPDHWPYETDAPRGAYVPPDLIGPAASYSIYDKVEVWADNCADLYEEAIRNRWPSATAIPWETLKPLPAHIEQSICQLCTNWSEDGHIGFETISKWLEFISYGYHEVKLYLSTQVFDLARHTETFRKRALANGGALGVQRPGNMHRAISSALKFSELVVDLNVVRTSFTLTILQRYGDALARSEADREMFRLVSRDLERHLAYGLEHLRYFLLRQPQKRNQVRAWLNRAEMMEGAEMRRNVPFNEALILLLDDNPRTGTAKLAALRRTQVEEYLDRLAQATVTDQRERLARPIQFYIEDSAPTNGAAAPATS